tara:strand:+ start:1201 stop:1659 length:459 start_codon:yes stop_codon:yes gene_type:complete
MYISRKHFKGFSCCFRQWKAKDTHCSFLHGYALSFQIEFKGELDERNWVWDFGGMKRAKGTIDGKSPKEWFDYMFDHTTIVASDDPMIQHFLQLDAMGVIQLRVIKSVGAEKFAEFIYNKVNEFVQKETDGRVSVNKVTVLENENNSATYEN